MILEIGSSVKWFFQSPILQTRGHPLLLGTTMYISLKLEATFIIVAYAVMKYL